MDQDINRIILEDQRLARELEDARGRAKERIELRRRELAEFRLSELNRIAEEYRIKSEEKLQGITGSITDRLREAQTEQERLLSDDELKNKITGRIVSVILDDRT